MAILTSFICGLLFGIGLLVSGMANPAKVLGFLDLAGGWDPSLVFVMGAAVAVGAVAFRLAGQRSVSWIGEAMRLPRDRRVDRRLVAGALLFGSGWGLVGFCPGPALVALGMGRREALLFVIAMLLGMLAFELLEWRNRAPGVLADAAVRE